MYESKKARKCHLFLVFLIRVKPLALCQGVTRKCHFGSFLKRYFHHVTALWSQYDEAGVGALTGDGRENLFQLAVG